MNKERIEVNCDYCGGYGYFPERISEDEEATYPCDYCNGFGYVEQDTESLESENKKTNKIGSIDTLDLDDKGDK